MINLHGQYKKTFFYLKFHFFNLIKHVSLLIICEFY